MDDIVTPLDAVLQSSDVEESLSPVTPEMLGRLRCAFSTLSKSVLLLEHHQPEQALRALPEIYRTKLSQLPTDCEGYTDTGDAETHVHSCRHCQDFLLRNPAYLGLPHRYARLLQDAVDLAARAPGAGAYCTHYRQRAS